MFTHEADDFYITLLYGDGQRPLRVVPESFRRVPYSQEAKKVPGDSPLFEIDGHYYFGTDEVDLPGDEKIRSGFYTIDFGRYERSVRMEWLHFRGADGKIYVFAYPLNAYSYFNFNNVKAINMMK